MSEQQKWAPLNCDSCGRDINDNDTFLSSTCEACGPDRVVVSEVIIWAVHGKPTGSRTKGPVIGYRGTSKDADEFAKGRGGRGGPGRIEKKAALKVGERLYVLESRDEIDFVGDFNEYYANIRAGFDVPTYKTKIEIIANHLHSLSDKKLDGLIDFLGVKP